MNFDNRGTFKPILRKIKARQLKQVQQFCDIKTGEKFIGQVGDFKIWDDNGNSYMMHYFQFIQRYMPDDSKAFDIFYQKQKVYQQKGKDTRDFRLILKTRPSAGDK